MAADRRSVRGRRGDYSVRSKSELLRRINNDRRQKNRREKLEQCDGSNSALVRERSAARRQKIAQTQRISRSSEQADVREGSVWQQQEPFFENEGQFSENRGTSPENGDQLFAASEGEYDYWDWDYEEEPGSDDRVTPINENQNEDYEEESGSDEEPAGEQENWNWDYEDESEPEEISDPEDENRNWDGEGGSPFCEGSDQESEAPDWGYEESEWPVGSLEPSHEEEENLFFLNSDSRKNSTAEPKRRKSSASRENPKNRRHSKGQAQSGNARPSKSQTQPKDHRPPKSQAPSEAPRPRKDQVPPEDQRSRKGQVPSEDPRPRKDQVPSEDQRPRKGHAPSGDSRPRKSQAPSEDSRPRKHQAPQVEYRPPKDQWQAEDRRPHRDRRRRKGYRPTGVPEPYGRARGERRVHAWVIGIVALLALAAGFGLYYMQLANRCVKESLTVEAGEACPSVESFLEWERKDAYIVEGIDENMILNHVQDYTVVIHVYHRDVRTTLHVVDTVPPVIQTKDLSINLGDSFEVEDFVENVNDVTDWDINYKEMPDVQRGGSYVITLLATDEGGNVAEAQAKLDVFQDTTPPVISGVQEISIMIGESVSYKRDVTVTDDTDETVALEVDISEVNTDLPGDYKVIYRATDKAGNTTEVSTILHVKSTLTVDNKATPGIPVTEESVIEAADKILASITDPSMTQYEVIRAIYDFCHNKIAYANGTPKTSWVEGAYCGLIQRKGDCYAYAMSSKCLLDRAGIVNMDIERIRVGNGMHFWNLVDIGEGWYHFDTCRRGDGSNFFYLTDAELMEYSRTHTAPDYPDGSHNYDRSLYPEIQ